MKPADQRAKLRAVMADTQCVLPASVYDALTARVAEKVGYELGLLSGSVVQGTTLAAPDILVHTATEYAEQIRRIARVSKLSLYVDADNGYGNALNVMRTVAEFEHAGVAGLAIEDTMPPMSFGHTSGILRLVPIAEGAGKMRAALAARRDPSLVIVARTPAIKLEGLESGLARARVYAACGVDAIHITGGVQKLEHLRAVHEAAKLPLIVGGSHIVLKREDLAANGARVVLPGHQMVAAAVKAVREVYEHLYKGGAPADLKYKLASAQEMDELVGAEPYGRWLTEYMQ